MWVEPGTGLRGLPSASWLAPFPRAMAGGGLAGSSRLRCISYCYKLAGPPFLRVRTISSSRRAPAFERVGALAWDLPPLRCCCPYLGLGSFEAAVRRRLRAAVTPAIMGQPHPRSGSFTPLRYR